MNRHINSFQNKLTVWTKKLILCKKETPQNGLLFVCMILSYLTLEGPGRQTAETRSTSAYPCKLGGMTVQTSYVGGRLHQN